MNIRSLSDRTRLVFLAVALSVALCIAGVDQARSEAPSGFRPVAENDYLTLYIDEETTAIAVEWKTTGDIWYSNPPVSGTKGEVASPLVISYYTEEDNQRLMNCYDDSVQYGQFKIEEIENGVRVEYLFGREWADQDYVPAMISKERLEEIVNTSISDQSDREFILGNYMLVSFEETAGDNRYEIATVQGVDMGKLFGTYKWISVESVQSLTKRELNQAAQLVMDTIIQNQSSIISRSELTYKDLDSLRSAPTYLLRPGLWAWDIEEMVELFRAAGVTPEELQGDYERYGLDKSERNICVFTVPVEYRLEDEHFVVTVPVGEAKYPLNVLDKDGNEISYPLATIDVLPYFGAAAVGETGYIFVPDGSGALIDFKQAPSAPAYVGQVYGDDFSVVTDAVKSDLISQVYLPVYGVRKNDQAYLAVIEDGAALARIKADVARSASGYNRVWSTFTVVAGGQIRLRGKRIAAGISTVPTYSPFAYDEDITIRYAFMSGERASYVGMADFYHRYLKSRFSQKRVEPGDGVPLYLEVIGGIDVRRPILGVSVEAIQPLTRYSDLERVVGEFYDRGIANIKVKYVGWLRGGIRHGFPLGVRLENALGQRSELERAVSNLAAMGVDVYPDVSLQNVYRDTLFDGFSRRSDSARAIDKRDTRVYDYSLVTLRANLDRYSHVLAPRKLDSLVDAFLAEYRGFGFGRISIADSGTQVSSDMSEDPTRFTTREESSRIIAEQLEKVSQDHEIMLDGANSYALPYAAHVVNAPLGSNKADILDQEVPFLQMTLHGLVNLSGKALNLYGSSRDLQLKHIETGMYPHYVVYHESQDRVKDTPHNDLFTGQYQRWMGEILEFYREVDGALRDVQDQRIVDHRQVSDNVYMTVYENGVGTIVNYGDEAVTVEGVTVAGKDYVRIEVSERCVE